MLILTLRTDKPEAELGLYDDQKQLVYETWAAHRALAETIHKKLAVLLKQSGKELTELQGIVAYQGPGSFTGLRIGLSVGNALAYSLNLSVVTTKDNWIEQGIERLKAGQSDALAMPYYGSEAHVTSPLK